MTNKEAIFYLKQVREDYEGKEFVEGKEALDFAIKAFEFINENYPKTFIDYLNGEQI